MRDSTSPKLFSLHKGTALESFFLGEEGGVLNAKT